MEQRAKLQQESSDQWSQIARLKLEVSDIIILMSSINALFFTNIHPPCNHYYKAMFCYISQIDLALA